MEKETNILNENEVDNTSSSKEEKEERNKKKINLKSVASNAASVVGGAIGGAMLSSFASSEQSDSAEVEESEKLEEVDKPTSTVHNHYSHSTEESIDNEIITDENVEEDDVISVIVDSEPSFVSDVDESSEIAYVPVIDSPEDSSSEIHESVIMTAHQVNQVHLDVPIETPNDSFPDNEEILYATDSEDYSNNLASTDNTNDEIFMG